MHGTAQKAGRPLSSPDPLCQSPKSPFLSPPTLSSPTLTPLPRLSPAAAALALTFLSPASHDSLALLLLPFKQRAPASHRSSLSPLLILQPAFSVPSAARFMARKRTARPPPPPPPNPNPNRRTAAAPPASGSGTAPSPSTKRMLALHFLRALSRIHSSTPVPRRSRTIRRAAYSSMARAANPRRAWTQALLRQVRVRRAMRTRRAVLLRRRVSAAPPAAAAPAAAAPPLAGSGNIVVTAGGETSAAATHRPPPRQAGEPARADALRRLVPGGGEMEYVSLLDETADYVRCLRAQVQLMQNLVDLFSGQ